MFVNANQLKIAPPPLNRSNSLPVLDMSATTQSMPVPLLQPLNVPRYMPSHARDPALDMTPPQQSHSLPMLSTSKPAPAPAPAPSAQQMEWPGPGSRIASLLPPEHLGTPLIGQLQLKDDFTPHHSVMPNVHAYPYAQQAYWMPSAAAGGHDQGLDLTMGMGHDDKHTHMSAEVMKRRHVCPVCDKRFNRPSSLNTHMAVHTGAKPFVCQYPDCGRRFSVSSNLRRHEKTHNVRQDMYSEHHEHEHEQDQEHELHRTPSHSRHPSHASHVSHSSTSSFAGFSLPSMTSSLSMTTETRPATGYSDSNPTPRQTSAFSAGSLPSGMGMEFTPYQAYNYPLPHHQSAPAHAHAPPPVQAHLALPHPSSSHSNSEFDFLHSSLPPISAKSVGMNLESYQVVSGPASGSGSGSGRLSKGEGEMSRSSSVSITMEAIHTPGSGEEDGQGEAEGASSPP